MTNDWAVPGVISVALTHFATVGVCLIAGERGGAPARFWWSDELRPRALVANDGGSEAAARAVRAHAARHTQDDSWLRAILPEGKRAGAATFTPRGGWPDPKGTTEAEWSAYLTERRAARAKAHLSALDEAFMSALGEPAWWRSPGKDDRPDDGASRWEMKTRNRGSEIFKDRLIPLAEAVAARGDDAVRRGLTGEMLIDETGKDAADSRTATGLATPRPVDSAVAWCALWGLSTTRLIRRWTGRPGPGNFRGVSAASGIAGDEGSLIGGTHPTRAALPIFTSPVSARRWGDVLATRQFFETAFDATGGDGAVEALAARAWLQQQGVRALVRFPILKTGSSSAPERQLLDGTLEEL